MGWKKALSPSSSSSSFTPANGLLAPREKRVGGEDGGGAFGGWRQAVWGKGKSLQDTLVHMLKN